jgi:hypothetical protein
MDFAIFDFIAELFPPVLDFGLDVLFDLLDFPEQKLQFYVHYGLLYPTWSGGALLFAFYFAAPLA